MRLLNTSTLTLHDFTTEAAIRQRYAILSHTWGDHEVTLNDLLDGRARSKPAFAKIRNTCRVAREQHGLDYCWIDSCCIDKRSSAELSLSINSMYTWYSRAEICLVHFSDVVDAQFPSMRVRWFTRGWTLQELLACQNLVFYSANWKLIGWKRDLIDEIAHLTDIDRVALRYPSMISTFNVATRMSWASSRQTSLVEDRAYSLLGIFDISMPLVYGEGYKAFLRLQEEIVKKEDDHSILVWKRPHDASLHHAVFAPSPSDFQNMQGIITLPPLETSTGMQLVPHGMRLDLPICEHPYFGTLAILSCRLGGYRFRQVCLWLEPAAPNSSKFKVCRDVSLSSLTADWTSENDFLDRAQTRSILLLHQDSSVSKWYRQVFIAWQVDIGIHRGPDFASRFNLETKPARLIKRNGTFMTLPLDESTNIVPTILFIRDKVTGLTVELHIYSRRSAMSDQSSISLCQTCLGRTDSSDQEQDCDAPLPCETFLVNRSRCKIAVNDHLAIVCSLERVYEEQIYDMALTTEKLIAP